VVLGVAGTSSSPGFAAIDPTLVTIALLGLDSTVRTGSIILLGVLAILAADRAVSRVGPHPIPVVGRD
jgi:hypothetical protein